MHETKSSCIDFLSCSWSYLFIFSSLRQSIKKNCSTRWICMLTCIGKMDNKLKYSSETRNNKLKSQMPKYFQQKKSWCSFWSSNESFIVNYHLLMSSWLIIFLTVIPKLVSWMLRKYCCVGSGSNKISLGRVKKSPSQREVGLLFTAGQKYARVRSGQG